MPPLFLFSGGGVFPFPRPPDFFGPGRAFFPRSAPFFPRAAPPVSRPSRASRGCPPGVCFGGRRAIFRRSLQISPDFRGVFGDCLGIFAHFRAFPMGFPQARGKPRAFPRMRRTRRGGLGWPGERKIPGGDPGIMAPPHSSDASRAASIFAAFAAAAALWASLAGALHDTSFAGHSK